MLVGRLYFCAVFVFTAAFVTGPIFAQEAPTNPKPNEPASCKNGAVMIDTLPFSIRQSNTTYCLSKSFEDFKGGAALAIFPNVENIIIDLNQFKIATKPDAEAINYGIEGYGIKNVTVRNGAIDGFFMCVRLGTDGANYVIENLTLNHCTFRGIFVRGENSIVRNNKIENTGGYTAYDPSFSFGIELAAGNNANISDNFVKNTFSLEDGGEAVGISISDASKGTIVKNNNIVNDDKPANDTRRSIGIWVGGHSDVKVEENRINGFDWGIGMPRDASGLVTKNRIRKTNSPLIISGNAVDDKGKVLTNWE